MNMKVMKNYFFERSKFEDFKSNKTYHELLRITDEEFDAWAKLLRKEVTEQWDEKGIPPVIGKNRDGIIQTMIKLRNNPADFFLEDTSGDEESLGVIKNFNHDAGVVNQFFPTMLKTKISTGKTEAGAVSIYDSFSDAEREDFFINVMKRTIRRDSMYAWSRSLTDIKKENEFWSGQTPVQFLKENTKGNIFTGKWANYDLMISKTTESAIKKYGSKDEDNRVFGNIFFLVASELRELVESGELDKKYVINIKDLPDGETSKKGKFTKFYYNIRWYDKTAGIFPNILQSFRLGLGQPAVNFPALTAKLLYEKYTSHIKQDEPVNIYDSSSGWGGRITGAMSSRKKIHYIGTDPNPDNFIDDLGISRYEYIAKFFNSNAVDSYSETFGNFFETPSNANTYELFQDGSELIHNNPEFQKYKGKLDMSFTSPPYFNREQYSQDENQSFKAYSEYNDWRDNFLKPTLTTIYEYSKNDRYILWNIASIRISKSTYFESEEDSIKILKELGCEYKGKLKMLMSTMIGTNINKRESMTDGMKNNVCVNGSYYKYEPIFVFYKK